MNSTPVFAGCCGPGEAPAPRILSAFDRRHRRFFCTRFLASLRATGNNEVVHPVAVGLYPSEGERLVRFRGVQPFFRRETDERVPRRRLREFGEITRALSPATPVAYWDAGDVIFQARLQPLWELLRTHPGKLLAVREPCGHPDNPAVVWWTETITDPAARRDAQRTVFDRPFLNGGFLAGDASALTQYFDTVADWYGTAKLAGSRNAGDQLALNVYCHSRPEAWHEISESWNYCLCRRKRNTCYRRDDGRYVDVRGVPIQAVHGNASTLDSIPFRRTPF